MSQPPIVYSMTGSGVARGETELGDVAVEVRSVNGRSLTVKTRLPTDCLGLEGALEARVRRRLSRGTVTLAMDVRGAPRELDAVVDPTRFESVAKALRELAARHGLGPVALADVLAVPGVLAGGTASRVRGADTLAAELGALVDAAVERLLEARAADGAATVAALRAEIERLDELRASVAERAPTIVAEYREKLIARVNEFLAGRAHQIDDADVVRELGLFADRVDINEELDRLGAHVAEMRRRLAAGGTVGRELEFLLQETLREVNTIGSKSADAAVSHLVVAMKSCVDRLREHGANLE